MERREGKGLMSNGHFSAQKGSGQQELAFTKFWQLKKEPLVSAILGMDRGATCRAAPSFFLAFFLFFLSCQINACSLGDRTEGVIYPKVVKKGMHESVFSSSPACTKVYLSVIHQGNSRVRGTM